MIEENESTLEHQRLELTTLELDLKAMLEEESSAIALLSNTERHAQEKIAHLKLMQKKETEKGKTNEKENKKTLRDWEKKAVAHLKKAHNAVDCATRIQKSLKLSVSCYLCLKWTMDPVVLIPCGHLYCVACMESHRRVMKDGQTVVMCAFRDCASAGVPSTLQIENLDVSKVCRLFMTKKGTESTFNSLLETFRDNIENIEQLPTRRLLYRNRFYTKMALNIRGKRGKRGQTTFAALFSRGSLAPLGELSELHRRKEASTLIKRWWQERRPKKTI